MQTSISQTRDIQEPSYCHGPPNHIILYYHCCQVSQQVTDGAEIQQKIQKGYLVSKPSGISLIPKPWFFFYELIEDMEILIQSNIKITKALYASMTPGIKIVQEFAVEIYLTSMSLSRFTKSTSQLRKIHVELADTYAVNITW